MPLDQGRIKGYPKENLHIRLYIVRSATLRRSVPEESRVQNLIVTGMLQRAKGGRIIASAYYSFSGSISLACQVS